MFNYPDNIRWRLIKNRLFFGSVMVFTLIGVTPIILIIFKLISKGARQINMDFFTQVAPDTFEAYTAVSNGEIIPGGILNGIAGTLLMTVLAAAIAIPVGLLAGLYLYEHPTKFFARLVRDFSDIIQGIPSIVLGLIAYIWIVRNVTNGYSALAGSVSLSIMMLPLVIRSTEETMKMIPDTLKEAGLSLGVPYYKVIIKILIPTGINGLMTGIIMAVSRVIGETAPLMLTALGSPVVNLLINKPTSAVPLLIWDFYNDPNMADLIWSAALFLMGVVLTLNLIAKNIGQNTISR